MPGHRPTRFSSSRAHAVSGSLGSLQFIATKSFDLCQDTDFFFFLNWNKAAATKPMGSWKQNKKTIYNCKRKILNTTRCIRNRKKEIQRMPVQFINYSSSTVESMGIIIILYSQQQGEENTRICKRVRKYLHFHMYSDGFRWVSSNGNIFSKSTEYSVKVKVSSQRLNLRST